MIHNRIVCRNKINSNIKQKITTGLHKEYQLISLLNDEKDNNLIMELKNKMEIILDIKLDDSVFIKTDGKVDITQKIKTHPLRIQMKSSIKRRYTNTLDCSYIYELPICIRNLSQLNKLFIFKEGEKSTKNILNFSEKKELLDILNSNKELMLSFFFLVLLNLLPIYSYAIWKIMAFIYIRLKI